MARLVNMHTAALDNAHADQRAARVAPGQVGDFNEGNPSVKLWIKVGMLVTEGQLLASRAAALGDAPSMGELLVLREEVAKRDTVIEDLRARDAARVAEMKRVEARFGELAASHGDADALRAEVARLQAENASLRAALDGATAPDAPAAVDATAPTEPAPATPKRASRTS